MPKNNTMTEKVKIPQGVTLRVDSGNIIVKGPKGEVKKALSSPKVKTVVSGDEIIFTAENATQREKMLLGTFKAHIKNMIKGSINAHVYKLKICSGHFPMNVSLSGGQFIVKNFIGEKVPRILTLKAGATVKIEGQEVIVESSSKETAGQVAADIEQLTRRPGFDKRIFMDGIYITDKDGKSMKK